MPKAIDLFSGAGGTCVGLQAAGFEVLGVDIRPQPDYPGTFLQADAVDVDPGWLAEFDFVWASPPCKSYSTVRRQGTRPKEPDLLEPTRTLLAGHPLTCIENVLAAPLRQDLILSRDMFEPTPPFRKRRAFELSFPVMAPPRARATRRGRALVSATRGTLPSVRAYRRSLGMPENASEEERRQAHGIYHIRTGSKFARDEALGQTIPPAYAEYIGRAALRVLGLEEPGSTDDSDADGACALCETGATT